MFKIIFKLPLYITRSYIFEKDVVSLHILFGLLYIFYVGSKSIWGFNYTKGFRNVTYCIQRFKIINGLLEVDDFYTKNY